MEWDSTQNSRNWARAVRFPVKEKKSSGWFKVNVTREKETPMARVSDTNA